MVFETTIKTDTAIANTIIVVGLKLTNTSDPTVDDEQAFVRYEDDVADGAFQLITSDAGVDTTTTTEEIVAANTSYHIKLVIDGDRNVHLFINGERRARVLEAVGADHDLIPYIKVEADGAAIQVDLFTRGIRMSKDHNE